MFPSLRLPLIWHTKEKVKSDWSINNYVKADYNTTMPFSVKVKWKYKVLSKDECCMMVNWMYWPKGGGVQIPWPLWIHHATSYIISHIISYHYYISCDIKPITSLKLSNIQCYLWKVWPFQFNFRITLSLLICWGLVSWLFVTHVLLVCHIARSC